MSKPNIADAVQALQDVTEAVAEMEIEIARLRAELKTSNAERDEARREVCKLSDYYCDPMDLLAPNREADHRGWVCYKKEETQ